MLLKDGVLVYTIVSMKRGFTIIELLVVIAIIAMLAAVVFASLSHLQAKSRDARRMEDMREIQKALGLYYIDNNHFPVAATPITIDGTDTMSTALVDAGAMPSVPGDPVSTTYAYTYETNTGGTEFTLTFCLETDSIPNFAKGCTNTIAP